MRKNTAKYSCTGSFVHMWRDERERVSLTMDSDSKREAGGP